MTPGLDFILSVPQAGKMSASKFIPHFFSIPPGLRFWASLPPDDITLNPANNKIVQSHSAFQTGIGATTLATLDTMQLISHTRAALVPTIAFLQGSHGKVTAASEVHELPTKFHNILGSALFKWVGNTTYILAYLFNSVPGSARKSVLHGFPFSQHEDERFHGYLGYKIGDIP